MQDRLLTACRNLLATHGRTIQKGQSAKSRLSRWMSASPPLTGKWRTSWALEIRPTIGVSNKEWEFIVNPIVDISFGPGGETDFSPAVRLSRRVCAGGVF